MSEVAWFSPKPNSVNNLTLLAVEDCTGLGCVRRFYKYHWQEHNYLTNRNRNPPSRLGMPRTNPRLLPSLVQLVMGTKAWLHDRAGYSVA